MEQPASLDKWQVEFFKSTVKYLKKQEEEQKQLRKWRHYAEHAKKQRIRKKYQKKIREHYAKKRFSSRFSSPFLHPKCRCSINSPLSGGNWPYGIGAGLFPRPSIYPEGGMRP